MELNADLSVTFEFLKAISTCNGCGAEFTSLETLSCCLQSFCAVCLTSPSRTNRHPSESSEPEHISFRCPSCHTPTVPDSSTTKVFHSKLQRAGKISAPLSVDRLCENPNCAGDRSSVSSDVNSDPKLNEQGQIYRKASVYCQQCGQLLCDVCRDRHKTWFDKQQHVFTILLVHENCLTADIIRTVVTSREALCGECCEGAEVQCSCVSCNGLSVCCTCAFKKHRTHEVTDISECADVSRINLKNNHMVLSDGSLMVRKALRSETETLRQLFEDQKQNLKSCAEKRIQEIKRELDVSIRELNKVNDEQVRQMDCVRADVNKVADAMDRFSDYVNALVKVGSNCDVIDHDEECLKQRKELMAAAESAMHSISVAGLNNRISWHVNEQLTEDLPHLEDSEESAESESNWRLSGTECSQSPENSELNNGLLSRWGGRVRKRFGSSPTNTGDNIELCGPQDNIESKLKNLKGVYEKLRVQYTNEKIGKEKCERELTVVIAKNANHKGKIFDLSQKLTTLMNEKVILEEQEAKARNELSMLHKRNDLVKNGVNCFYYNDPISLSKIVPSARLNQ